MGVGHLGQHHARILSAMPGVDLVAVADARAEQAQAVAAKCGTVALGDYRPLLELVDAVTIAVPLACTEKSPGHSWKKASPPLSKSQWPARWPSLSNSWRWPEHRVRSCKSAISSDSTRHCKALEHLAVRPKFVNAERLSTYTFRSTDIGVVFDLMIHDLDLLLSLITAPVRSVAAVGVSLFGEHEDVANARIEFEDGSVANLTASRASYTPSRKMRIWGANGYASLDFAAKEATRHSPFRTAQTRPPRPRRRRLEPTSRGEGASVRQGPARRRVKAGSSRASSRSSLKTSSTRRAGYRVPGSAATTPCAQFGSPTRSCTAWKRTAGIATPSRPLFPQSKLPRSCAAHMPGGPGVCDKSPIRQALSLPDRRENCRPAGKVEPESSSIAFDCHSWTGYRSSSVLWSGRRSSSICMTREETPRRRERLTIFEIPHRGSVQPSGGHREIRKRLTKPLLILRDLR